MAADPAYVGRWLLSRRDIRRDGSLHALADCIDWSQMPAYDDESHSIAAETRAAYQHEIRTRAEAGDKAAISLLAGENPNDGAEE